MAITFLPILENIGSMQKTPMWYSPVRRDLRFDPVPFRANAVRPYVNVPFGRTRFAPTLMYLLGERGSPLR
ncbi:hypothetical protein PN482_04660 [Microcystis aeruginosa CS-555/01A07]|uniref:hypothetical protein n=1 Tax=Microcystis aeruginosa TaxID=1126 RepID=UPI002330DB1A|nr:hypothetical protein [Microcystis aeruginosa]MDB9428217.1 hypothetical protein [Microcystis aeruginosa CS-555/01A07]